MNKSRRTVIFGAIAGLSGILTFSKIQAKQIDNSKMLLDRAEIIDAVNIIGMGADLRDWKSCRAAFASKVLTDYTSLNGSVYLDGAKPSWTLGGYYNHILARINGSWKVAEIKMTWTWEQGTRPG